MALLLNPRFWIAAALAIGLAISHAFAYRTGKAVIRADWTAEKLAQTNQALELQAENQRTTARWAGKAQDAINTARLREATNRTAADGARAESDRLRDTIGTIEGKLPSLAASACASYAATAGAILRDMEAEGRAMAEKADGHASDALACVQAWPR